MPDTEPIDIVLAWVDGNDPVHKEKIRPYLNEADACEEDIAAPTRFSSDKEIFFCVASILKFAPFVRKIFIITDEQDPQLDEFAEKYFPDRTTEIEIVDHKVIFRGYEQILPTFNSRSIETCLFRIPGLSNNFVYMNDDFFILRPVTPQDWFIGNKLVVRGNWKNRRLDRLFGSSRGKKPATFKRSVLRAADMLGFDKKYLRITHTPRPLKRNIYEEFYVGREDILLGNISHKFRCDTHYNSQELCYLLASEKGKLILRRDRELYMKPVNRGDKYVGKKIKLYEKKRPAWGCIQSLDMADERDRRMIYEWLGSVLGVEVT